MQSLSNFLNKISNWKTLFLSLVVYMLFNLVFLKNAGQKMNMLSGKSIGVIDLTFGFNPQKTLKMVSEYSAEARTFYATTELTTDVVYPIVYTLFFGVILTLLFRNKSYTPYKTVYALPIFCLVFDLLENLCIVSLLKSYPAQNQAVAILCELVKTLKWLSFGLVIIFTLYGLVRLFLNKINPESKN